MSDITELIEPQAPKEEKPQKSGGGLISKEFFDFNLSNVFDYGRTKSDVYKIRNVRFINEQYMPLYAVNFKVDQYLPTSAIIDNNYEMNSYDILLNQKQGAQPWQANTVYVDFLKKCVETEQYNIVLFIDHKKDSICKTKNQLRKNLHDRFKEYTEAPIDLSIYREGRNNAKSYVDVIANNKYFCSWAVGKTRRADNEAAHFQFLTNFYYMAKLNELNGHYSIEPMYSVMVKKEYLSYVRACLLTNTPLPVEILELWVDSKLDKTDSDYKIRPTFIKSIRTPFKNAGMKIQVFDNLFETMYARLKMPKFKNIQERMEWIKELSAKLMDEERVLTGIKSREQINIETGATVFAAIDRLKDTFNDEARKEVAKKLEKFTEIVTELTS